MDSYRISDLVFASDIAASFRAASLSDTNTRAHAARGPSGSALVTIEKLKKISMEVFEIVLPSHEKFSNKQIPLRVYPSLAARGAEHTCGRSVTHRSAAHLVFGRARQKEHHCCRVTPNLGKGRK